MANTKLLLEHFYFGQLVSAGKPDGKPLLLASSPGITPDVARIAVERITLPPLIAHAKGSWALIRGNRQLPFLLVHSQLGGAGQLMSHYILMPTDVLRSIGGSVRTLHSLIEEHMPAYTDVGHRLVPLTVEAPDPETVEEQIDDTLELMTLTQNRLEVMETLLAAIVQNVQIVIQGAPTDHETRINFIEGLLALLPPSVRFAVTFTTHSLPTHENDAQIRFYSDDLPPEGTVVYNWPEARVTGEEVENDYARFVISQLRLDAQLVIERTRALVPATGWRMRQGDKLAEALAYGSHRLRIDQALLNNQPVDKSDVAKVLREDPTLGAEMRATYARHLLALTLAMNDPEQADPVADLLKDNDDLAQTAFQQLSNAIEDKQAGAAAHMLLRWLGGGYKLKDPENWSALANRAIMTRVEELAGNQDTNGLNTFIVGLHSIEPSLHTERFIPKVIETALPLAAKDAALAENVFILAAAHLNTSTFRRMLEMKPFTDQLRPPLRQFLALIRGVNPAQKTPVGVLMGVAREFGEVWEPLVGVRLAELAVDAGRKDLLDLTTLRGLATLAATPQGKPHSERLLRIMDAFDSSDLAVLGEDGGYHISRIRLACGDYATLANLLIQQSANLYRGERQGDYLRLVERLFSETPIAPEQCADALNGIQANGIKSAPLLMAALGCLRGRQPNETLNRIADQAEDMLTAEPRLLQVVPPPALLILLDYYARAGEAASAVRIANSVSLAVAEQGADPLPAVTQMYKIMERRDATRDAGLDVVRGYVRQAEDKNARVAIAYYGRELGGNVRTALEATYALKRLMGGTDLNAYATSVRTALGFLLDTASAYADSKNIPDTPALLRGLGEMSGNFLREDLRVFTRSLLSLMQSIVLLNQQHRVGRPRDIDGLVRGTAEPASALDMLRVVAGYYNGGRRQDMRFLTPPLAYPLGSRSRRVLADEVRTAAELLHIMARAFASDKPTGVTAKNLRTEAESLLKPLAPQTRDAVQKTLATDLQALVGLLEFIGDSGDARVVEDDSQIAKKIDTLKQRPRSVLEFYRLLYAYFVQRG